MCICLKLMSHADNTCDYVKIIVLFYCCQKTVLLFNFENIKFTSYTNFNTVTNLL